MLGYGAHPDLHSFPTRRSSDLAEVLSRQSNGCRGGELGVRHVAVDRKCAVLERRSEEHTSELQSHSELVCRLLLEKKNLPNWMTKRRRSTRYRSRTQKDR